MGLFNREKSQERLMKQQIRQQSQGEMVTSLSVATPNDELALLERKDKLVELTQWQQDRDKSMQKIFSKLSGYVYDGKNKTLTKSEIETPYCSVEGAIKLVGFIETLDHNIMLGSWDTDRINATIKIGICHPLRRFIYNKHKELGIPDIYCADYTLWLLVNTIEGNYMRGLNNGERRRDQEIRKVNEITTPFNEDKRDGKLFGVKI